MRVLLLLFFLLTMPAFADESTTCQPTNFINCTDCEIPGKYCLSGDGPAGNQCLPCSEGAYCPGDQKQYCCVGAFPFSDKDQVSQTGAKSQYEYYKKLDGETSNGHGAKCKDESDDDIEYSDDDNAKKSCGIIVVRINHPMYHVTAHRESRTMELFQTQETGKNRSAGLSSDFIGYKDLQSENLTSQQSGTPAGNHLAGVFLHFVTNIFCLVVATKEICCYLCGVKPASHVRN